MTQGDWLVGRFQESRGHLRKVAYRMLGSGDEADDAVQEAWLRVSNADTSAVENLGGWLTTVVARICLDILRSRGARREEALGGPGVDEAAEGAASADAEADLLLAESIGPALLVVLETLGPSERVAFVLHDMFDPLVRRDRRGPGSVSGGREAARQPRPPSSPRRCGHPP